MPLRLKPPAYVNMEPARITALDNLSVDASKGGKGRFVTTISATVPERVLGNLATTVLVSKEIRVLLARVTRVGVEASAGKAPVHASLGSKPIFSLFVLALMMTSVHPPHAVSGTASTCQDRTGVNALWV